MKKASALLIVMLVIAGVVTVVFGAERLTLVQYAQSEKEEDNIAAYYAAKAGIEDGLARYRWQNNYETGVTNVDNVNIDNVSRVDVTSFAYSTGDVKADTDISKKVTGITYDPTHQYYDLSVNYKGTQLTNYANPKDPYKLVKDDFIELKGFDSSEGTTYTMKFDGLAFTTPNTTTSCSNGFIQMQRVYTPPSQSSMTLGQAKITSTANTINFVPAQTTSIRLRSYNCDANFILSGTKDAGDKALRFDSLWTTVQSTGYYGSAKRTLIAKIDRKSGELLGVFDFNLYAGGNISPQ